ncbi:MAG: glycosyltransferase family 4 protein [Pseudomonadota bacterium]|nr:glycosyltransferase family 4 protein [Pseudomonadota bacterium]
MRADLVHFVVPGDINALTGGYIYDKHMIGGLQREGLAVKLHLLEPEFPLPSGSALSSAAATIEKISDGEVMIVDGLALGPLHEILEVHRHRLKIVGLIHHPLADETGLRIDVARDLGEAERQALSFCRTVVVTSQITRSTLIHKYDVRAEKICVIEPGVKKACLFSPRLKGAIRLICVASLIPRKGHSILVQALSLLADRPWDLTCIGDLCRDPQTSLRIRNLVRKFGLTHRIKFVGEVSESRLQGYYQKAGLFVLASHHEGYGMALSEAISWSVPVVSTTGGAIPFTVPRAASLLVRPGDVHALSYAIGRFMDEPRVRLKLLAGARGASGKQTSWLFATSCFVAEIRRIVCDE